VGSAMVSPRTEVFGEPRCLAPGKGGGGCVCVAGTGGRGQLTSAPGMRTSKRVALGGQPGGEMTRTLAARESQPYDAVSGAQNA